MSAVVLDMHTKPEDIKALTRPWQALSTWRENSAPGTHKRATGLKVCKDMVTLEARMGGRIMPRDCNLVMMLTLFIASLALGACS